MHPKFTSSYLEKCKTVLLMVLICECSTIVWSWTKFRNMQVFLSIRSNDFQPNFVITQVHSRFWQMPQKIKLYRNFVYETLYGHMHFIYKGVELSKVDDFNYKPFYLSSIKMISLKSFNCAHSLKNLASASTSGAKIQNDLLSLKRSLYRKMTTCLDRSSINEFDPSIGSLMAFLNAFFKSFIYSNNTTKRGLCKKRSSSKQS